MRWPFDAVSFLSKINAVKKSCGGPLVRRPLRLVFMRLASIRIALRSKDHAVRLDADSLAVRLNADTVPSLMRYADMEACGRQCGAVCGPYTRAVAVAVAVKHTAMRMRMRLRLRLPYGCTEHAVMRCGCGDAVRIRSCGCGQRMPCGCGAVRCGAVRCGAVTYTDAATVAVRPHRACGAVLNAVS